MLREILKAQNMTIAELARRVGTNPDYLYRVASDPSWMPRMGLAIKISKELNTPIENLWGSIPVEASNGN